MNVCRFSIFHPVTTIVMMVLIVLAGLIAFYELPIREYPDIETPMVSVSTSYTGAAPSVIETKITQIIENAVSGVDGISYVQSKSREGRSRISIEFIPSKDIDIAVNDVRDRVSRYLNKLPSEADNPVIAKYDSDSMPIMMIAITSDKMNRMEVTDYINRYLLDRFSVIDGVADARVVGKREKSIRVWLDKSAMAARNVTVSDIESALKRENLEYPSGRVESVDKEYPIVVLRKYNNVQDFENLVISKNKSGDFVKLRDIAEIEVSSKEQRDNFSCDGTPMVGIAISKQSNSNTVQIAEDVKKLISNLKENLPDGMSMTIMRDDSKFIQSSIHEVYETLFVAALLVFIIILAFIGSVKATIIPFITVPISIIGSFSIVALFGYSINMLTLLAMVLAIGIVVDDSIVVLENICRRIEEGEDPLTASIEGSKQVVFAVISTTCVLLAVFLPICIWSGKTGKLFSEFAVTISAAVLFSSIVALTLTPMLCAKMLDKNINVNNVIIVYIQNIMHWLSERYGQLLTVFLRYKYTLLSSFLILSIATGCVWFALHNEYEPLEDRSTFTIKSSAAEGTGFNKMNEYMANVEKTLVDNNLGIKHIVNVIPTMSASEGSVNSGQVQIELLDYDKRKNSKEIAAKYRKLLKELVGVKSSVILPTGIASKGSSPIQFIVTGPEYDELKTWRDIIFEKCKDYPGIVDIDCDYKETTPQFQVDIDQSRAAELGVSIKDIGATLETMFGSKGVTSYIERGREYDVILQASKDDRNSISDLRDIYVRNTQGDLVSLDNLLNISENGCARSLSRFNRNRAITITANVGEGYALDQSLTYLENVVKNYLPPYAQIFYKGQSKDLKESAGGLYFVFFLAIVISFLALASQFDSFISPIIVMTSVPLGAFGAVLGLKLFGYSLNIYNQIGLLMLIGLSAKQGILIVEFANQLMDEEKLDVVNAAIKASKLRLRPIIMTCLSTVAGAIPLLLATGASSISRKNIGIVEVFGGISGGIFITILVPILYIMINKNRKRQNLS